VALFWLFLLWLENRRSIRYAAREPASPHNKIFSFLMNTFEPFEQEYLTMEGRVAKADQPDQLCRLRACHPCGGRGGLLKVLVDRKALILGGTVGSPAGDLPSFKDQVNPVTSGPKSGMPAANAVENHVDAENPPLVDAIVIESSRIEI
jgi:hypothetical protein